MPEISATPEINYCASVLAKAVRSDNGDAFAQVHDELGKTFGVNDLETIENLAKNYSELPIHILEKKISWLQPLVKLDLTNFLKVNVGNVTNVESAKPSGIEVDRASQMDGPQPSGYEELQPLKKKNKKGKSKQKQAEDADVEKVEETEKQEDLQEEKMTGETVAIEELENPESSSSSKRKKKKKKKKKGKSGSKHCENESEKQELTPPEPVEWKSPEETTASAFDSGIGSCVASGGEDKSSVLSGGTIESNGEHAETASPIFCFESNGDSTISDFLQTEKVPCIEENTSNSEDTKNPNRFRISFGEPLAEEQKSDEMPSVVVPRKDKKSMNKKSGTKYQPEKTCKREKSGTDSDSFELTFVTPSNIPDEAVPAIVEKTNETDIDTPEKFASKHSTFDHRSAVLFLWSEWNRTLDQ